MLRDHHQEPSTSDPPFNLQSPHRVHLNLRSLTVPSASTIDRGNPHASRLRFRETVVVSDTTEHPPTHNLFQHY
ncbi:hypothetical protein Acr_23g0015430 [Actinidia rufa]|uniref:Uncharacterized protein n=1 Tax=Actinidia rufa TaxID=165716 RepID=A0A7J0GQW8_9ERIC|nr:hypothetical protein Acr_23g0015430 [Actinidia rufa]